jgi:hypothetical protein
MSLYRFTTPDGKLSIPLDVSEIAKLFPSADMAEVTKLAIGDTVAIGGFPHCSDYILKRVF